MIKRLPYYIKKKLLSAYNHIWNTEIFPTSWRESYLIPIPKPGKATNDPKNLRPIYLSSCMMKLFERMINRRLMNELENKNILGANQSAFRKGRQTLDPLTEIEDIYTKAIDEHKHVELIFLDLEKAYDKTWRHLILKNLAKAGIGGRMAIFCEGFLKERNFKVLYQGHFSSSKNQQNGVPQGSVLAVTFFLLAINSIHEWLPKDITIKLYADDITIAITSRCARWTRQRVQNTLKQLEAWCSATGFTVSIQKSTIMHIGSRKKLLKQPAPIFLQQPIKITKTTRMLGIWLDHKLNFKHHIQVKREECKQVIALMRCIGGTNFGADRKSLLRILNTMLIPRLIYGAPIISGANNKDLSRLSPIYHQGIRIATGAFHSSPIESLLSESGQLPLPLRIAEALILYSTKQVSRNIIPSTCNLVKRANENAEILNIPPTKVVTTKQNYDDPEHLNGINLDIADSSTPAEKKARFQEIRQTKYQHHKHIYTDGSKTNQGTGCGIFAPNQEISIKLRSSIHL